MSHLRKRSQNCDTQIKMTSPYLFTQPFGHSANNNCFGSEKEKYDKFCLWSEVLYIPNHDKHCIWTDLVLAG